MNGQKLDHSLNIRFFFQERGRMIWLALIYFDMTDKENREFPCQPETTADLEVLKNSILITLSELENN